MTNRELLRTFRTVSSMPDRAQRGYALERLMANIFRAYHFETTRNPGAAGPRQVDLIATRDTDTYLVETKWRGDNVNIADIDSLRSRLRRVPGHVTGILVSIEGFTQPVIDNVAAYAEHPVLLISGGELERVLRDHESLLRLLHRKQDALLTDGAVVLDTPPAPRSAGRRAGDVALPESTAMFTWPDGHRTRVVECGGTFGQFVFAQEIPDVDWVQGGGKGATLDLYPEVFSERGLLNVVHALASLGWATEQSRWSIQQSSRNWHGMGVAEFASSLPNWKDRAASNDSHHSEEICYADVCDGGFYTLTANLAAHDSRLTSMVTLSFQLQGIPLDSAPFTQLCKSLGIHEPVYFRSLEGRSVTRIRNLAVAAGAIEPVALIVQPDDTDDDLLDGSERTDHDPVDEWVVGIVIPNLLRPASPRKDTELDLRMLESSELLICKLPQHHRLDDPVAYTLDMIETTDPTNASVYTVNCDWQFTEEREQHRDLTPGRVVA